MATKKKKSDSIVLDMPGTIGSATLVFESNKPSSGWPKIQQGTHLTVKTFENGSTELIWDDEALAREVREAIASVENKGDTNVKTKKTRKSK